MMKKLLLSVFSCFLASVFLFSSAGAVSIEQAQPVMPQITAYVRDDAGELAGLTAKDVSAELDGVPLAVEGFEQSSQGIYYVFMLDISASVSEPYLNAAKDAILRIYDGLRPEDQLAFITFGEAVKVLFTGNDDPETVRSTIDSLVCTDMETHFYDAVKTLVETADKKDDMRKLAVVVSDGIDNGSSLTKSELEEVLRLSGVSVYALGVDFAGQEALDDFSAFVGLTGGVLYTFAPDSASSAMDKLTECLADTWMLTLSAPTNEADGELHRLKISFGEAGEAETAIRPKKSIPDATVPYILSIDADRASGTIKVSFSENVLGADDTSVYSLVSPTGAKGAFSSAAINGSELTLSSADIASGGWTLEIGGGITDASVQRNPLSPFSYELFPGEAVDKPEELISQDIKNTFMIPVMALAVLIVLVILFFVLRKRAKSDKPEKGGKAKKEKEQPLPRQTVQFFFNEDDKK